MAPIDGRVAKPERRWDCRRSTPSLNEDVNMAHAQGTNTRQTRRLVM